MIGYESISEAIAFVNARARALYYFGRGAAEVREVLARPVAGGGVTVNHTILHTAQEDGPCDGLGGSGVGHYRGIDGFREFSTPQTVFHPPRVDALALLRPPYTLRKLRLLEALVRH